MTTLFVVVGALGFGLLVLGVVLDDFLDGVFDAFDLDAGGVLSAPVIGAFLGAFGVGGWVATTATGNGLIGLVAAVVAGLILGWAGLRLTLAFTGMHTDATPGSRDYVGQLGSVVTPIAGGRGEIMLRLGGSQRKLTAQCDTDLERGAQVVVIEAISPSAVRVLSTAELFEQE